MNPRLLTLINPKSATPEFIRRRDIRGITPEFLMSKFKNRATKKVDQDKIVVFISRKNQLPDTYIFDKSGKFESRYVSLIRDNDRKYITTKVYQDGYSTNVITRKSEQFGDKFIDTIFSTVKKPKKGFLGFIGLNSEKLDLKMRVEKENTDIFSINKKVKKWFIRLSNKREQLKAYDNSKTLKIGLLKSDKKTYEGKSQISQIQEFPSELIKRAVKWFDGDFSR